MTRRTNGSHVADTRPAARSPKGYNRRETIAGLLFISPWIVGFLVFTVISMSYSLVLSFTSYDLATNTMRPVGTANFEQLVENPRVLASLGNTFTFALMAVPVELSVALLMAVLLNSVGRGSAFFRVLFYLPKMTPAVATAAVFLLLLNGNQGAINKALAAIGIQGPQWLLDPAWVKPSIVVMSAWAVAGSAVILLAALQGVPIELYEAAAIDGAGPLRTFTRITIPMISPTLFFLVITLTIASLQVFDQAYLLFYRDGADSSAPEAALFYGVYLYQQAFQQFNFGLAAAMAWLLFAIIMLITVVQLTLGKRLVHYESGQGS
ncbi:carbohydrate ABC transporter permease [Tessaracoccus lapidicaptus]|uniref:carbohydrate ABC transporter permease n=1 Tax=Tessaracoccus lapidicaptus TaxID=1427523 RepID=UPI003341AF50